MAYRAKVLGRALLAVRTDPNIAFGCFYQGTSKLPFYRRLRRPRRLRTSQRLLLSVLLQMLLLLRRGLNPNRGLSNEIENASYLVWGNDIPS
jgi:hypothetical protein